MDLPEKMGDLFFLELQSFHDQGDLLRNRSISRDGSQSLEISLSPGVSKYGS